MRTGEEFMAKFTNGFSRRTVLKGSAALGGAIAAPTFFMRHAFGADFRNNPGSNASVPFGFNVPQTGPYADEGADRSEEHTSELQSLMRISYAVFCLKKKNN